MFSSQKEINSYLEKTKEDPVGLLIDLEERVKQEEFTGADKFKVTIILGSILGRCLVENIEGAEWKKNPIEDGTIFEYNGIFYQQAVFFPTNDGRICRICPMKQVAMFFENPKHSLVETYGFAKQKGLSGGICV